MFTGADRSYIVKTWMALKTAGVVLYRNLNFRQAVSHELALTHSSSLFCHWSIASSNKLCCSCLNKSPMQLALKLCCASEVYSWPFVSS